MGMTECFNCRYYKRDKNVEGRKNGKGGGQCRRKSPDVYTPPGNSAHWGVFPGVSDKDWCGEFCGKDAS